MSSDYSSDDKPRVSNHKYPNLEGRWQFRGQRVRYIPLPDGSIIPPDINEPEDFPFEATITQNGKFFFFDTPSFTGPPRLGVISGKKGKWNLRIVETNDNGFYTAFIKKRCPKKFELVYTESGFACPRGYQGTPKGYPRESTPQPCELTQTPTVLSGVLRRKKSLF